MIKYAAVVIPNYEGGELLIVQRVHLYERAHNTVPAIEPRQFEVLAAPFVMQKFPSGRILGFFESTQTLSNSGDVEIGFEDLGAQHADGRR